jgi:glyceraldehyde-3-phosphate dehydrogenase/erythrose-4-phosphate dehydrogenase
MKKIAINGMGRIGRATQNNIGHKNLELIAYAA